MDNKINNANTGEMKGEKAMQEIDMEDLENVAGGTKIKEVFERIRMSKNDEKKMRSLLSSYRDSVSGILYLEGLIDASYGDEDHLKRLREERRKRELKMGNIESELNILAKKFPNISELREFRK